MNSVTLKLLFKKVKFDLYHLIILKLVYTVIEADLWDSLISFMEISCIGDFELRLKMMKSFHVEMIMAESTI